jgi:beta-fructofuranosidase
MEINMGKLEECNGFLRDHTDNFFIDRYRLGYHLSSPCGWMNDPHNPILFQGQYHVFFNLFPYEAEGFRPKFWGHAVSEDMVDFTFLPCALAPDSDLDKNGCASGCAVVKDGRVYLIYTGKNEEREPRELQVIAVSEDGIKFIKPDCNPILKVDGVTGQNCRDPRAWEQSGKYYMLLGNTDEGNGRALLFSSKDLFKWDDEGVFCSGNGSQGYMWECPDYVRINSDEFLILSAEGMSNMRSVRFTLRELRTEEAGDSGKTAVMFLTMVLIFTRHRHTKAETAKKC